VRVKQAVTHLEEHLPPDGVSGCPVRRNQHADLSGSAAADVRFRLDWVSEIVASGSRNLLPHPI